MKNNKQLYDHFITCKTVTFHNNCKKCSMRYEIELLDYCQDCIIDTVKTIEKNAIKKNYLWKSIKIISLFCLFILPVCLFIMLKFGRDGYLSFAIGVVLDVIVTPIVYSLSKRF